MITLLAAALAVADDAAPRRGLFSQMHYGVGVVTELGVGTDATVFGERFVAEPLAFELRSFLTKQLAFHTTLNLTRMAAPALREGDGRIDYGCHFGAHLPLPRGPTVVIAPGAEIAYSFTGSRYQRIQGDVRLGLDFARGDWVTGVYLAPYAGWYRPVGEERGHVTGGVAIDLSMVYMVPKKGVSPPAR